MKKTRPTPRKYLYAPMSYLRRRTARKRKGMTADRPAAAKPAPLTANRIGSRPQRIRPRKATTAEVHRLLLSTVPTIYQYEAFGFSVVAVGLTVNAAVRNARIERHILHLRDAISETCRKCRSAPDVCYLCPSCEERLAEVVHRDRAKLAAGELP